MITTANGTILTLEPGLDYVYIFEDYELAFTKEQLDRIAESWNGGKEVDEIAKEEKRDSLEVFLSLIYLAKKRRKLRPFAYRV